MVTFSIISATYNVAPTLHRFLSSLAQQTFRDFNVIIQDGASTDQTLAIAHGYAEKLPALYIKSKPDTGIYQAWNRAVKKWWPRLGEWVLFLGADDALVAPDTLQKVAERLKNIPKNNHYLFAAGDVVMCDGQRELFRVHGLHTNVVEHFRQAGAAVHSALFQHRSLFESPPFDEAFRISGDHDFVIRNWKSDAVGFYLDLPITRMNIGGATSSLRNVLRFRYEVMTILYRHFGLMSASRQFVGVLKGLLPYTLTKIYSEEKALTIYNRIRNLRGMDNAIIK